MSELKDLNRETEKILSTIDWLVIEEPNEAWESHLKFEGAMLKDKHFWNWDANGSPIKKDAKL